MQERGFVGLEARAADGTEVGRIAEVVSDEESGAVTYVIVETEGGEQLEVPITRLSLDPDADFATFHADASDEEPGDHTDDEVEPEDYAPDDLAGWGGRVLILEADDDPLFPPAARDALRALYPGAEVHTFHGTGHAAAVLRPDEYAAVLLRFFRAAA